MRVRSERAGNAGTGRATPWQPVFAALLALSLVVRLVVLWFATRAPLASDSEDYREMAVQLTAGIRFVPYWPPGLSLYLSPFVAAGFGNIVLRASMLVWWVLFCWGFMRLARDLIVRDNVWLLILAIFSVTPALIHFSIEPMTQMPAAALLLWALSATVRCSKGAGWGESLLLGGVLGLFTLVRPSGLPLLLVLPVMVHLQRRNMAQPAIAVALGTAMVFAWVVKVHQLSDRWMINNSNGANAYYGNNPWTPYYRTWYFGSHAKLGTGEIHQFSEFEEITKRIMTMPEVDRGNEYKRLAVEHVVHRPDLFLLRTANRVRCFWGFDIFTAANLRKTFPRGFALVFAADAACYLIIAGFAVFWIGAAPRAFWGEWSTWLLAGTVFLYSLPYWVTMSHPTYHFPVMAPLALMGAIAHTFTRHYRKAAWWRGWQALALLAAIQAEWLYYIMNP